jgi:protein-tyrosine-phosphatase/DNA-binding transcriptional ArsR family regulator
MEMILLNIPETPDFLKLISHDVRWRIMKALSSSDLRVQELVERVGKPQNLVSYHLQRLRERGLVHERRSIADAREVYYSLDLERVRAHYQASGEELHPALAGFAGAQIKVARDLPAVRVLFLCTHNSARSQMAEALLRHRSQGQIEAFSAGNQPAQVHPLAQRVMKEMGIDISGQTSKSLEIFLGQSFDTIITVCDKARESCPVFPGDPLRLHWSFPDPAEVEGGPEMMYQAFKETAIQLSTRISYLMMIIQRDREN